MSDVEKNLLAWIDDLSKWRSQSALRDDVLKIVAADDWRLYPAAANVLNCIPDEIIELWDDLSLESRLLAYALALKNT